MERILTIDCFMKGGNNIIQRKKETPNSNHD